MLWLGHHNRGQPLGFVSHPGKANLWVREVAERNTPFLPIFCLRYHGTVSQGRTVTVMPHLEMLWAMHAQPDPLCFCTGNLPQRQMSAVLAGHGYWKYGQAKAQGGGGGGMGVGA